MTTRRSEQADRFDRLRAMTPEQHLQTAMIAAANPPGSGGYADELLYALVHLGMAQVKQAQRGSAT